MSIPNREISLIRPSVLRLARGFFLLVFPFDAGTVLHRVLEGSNGLAQALAHLGQTLGAEGEENNQQDDHEFLRTNTEHIHPP